jgi:hypothetical protein
MTQQSNEDDVQGWRWVGAFNGAMTENGKVVERSMVAAMDDGKATAQQDLEAATEKEQEMDAISEDNINRQRYRRIGVRGQQAKRSKAGL